MTGKADTATDTADLARATHRRLRFEHVTRTRERRPHPREIVVPAEEYRVLTEHADNMALEMTPNATGDGPYTFRGIPVRPAP